MEEIMKKYPVEYTESMNTVLTQELNRFNGLISIVRSSLHDIGLALVGKIIMSTALEAAPRARQTRHVDGQELPFTKTTIKLCERLAYKTGVLPEVDR